MLAWTIYISFLGAAAMLLLPKGNTALARTLALLTAVAGFSIALTAFAHHRTGEMLTITRMPWIPSLGVEYHLAADGISLTLVLLTGIIAITGVLFSWNIDDRTKEFFAFYLLLIGAVYGVFLSYDIFLLFVFYEVVIIPKYFLIAIWGSTRREYGAMKLALYSFIGSAMVLIGLIAAYIAAGSPPRRSPIWPTTRSRRTSRCSHSHWSSWASRFLPASGPSTPGRPPATSPRLPPPPCCSPAW